MVLSKDNHLNHCDDCGREYTKGYIIKSSKKEIRTHLCESCLKKLTTGDFELGQGLKRQSSKLIKDYYPSKYVLC